MSTTATTCGGSESVVGEVEAMAMAATRAEAESEKRESESGMLALPRHATHVHARSGEGC